MGRFDARATQPARGFADIIKWKVLDPLSAKRKVRKSSFQVPWRDNDGELIARPEPSLTWIGHASFVMRLGGRIIAFDPVFSAKVGLIRRLSPPGITPDRLPSIDLVLISHNHYDHLDLPSLLRIGPGAVFIVPLGNGSLLRKAGLPQVVELDWWQSFEHEGLTITLVPSRHWSMRTLWDRNEALWGGFVVKGPEGTAYHSGDTAFFEGFREIGERLGPIDWAMLPIGAYEPRWFMHPQHLDPEEAGEAFGMLKARYFVAMHWGTFQLTDEPVGEPPERIRAYWQKNRLPEEGLWVLDVGETRRL